jgi:hypothetical protein
MSEPKVVSLKGIAPGHYVRVDRGTDWGNPFVMRSQTELERHRVCGLYEQYAQWRMTVDPEWLDSLRGKNLACWCAPKRCHADTLLRLANE